VNDAVSLRSVPDLVALEAVSLSAEPWPNQATEGARGTDPPASLATQICDAEVLDGISQR
jgi:hypothetical protein